MIDTNYENELSGLSEEEKQAVLNILNEISTKGQSDTYTQLLNSEYKETPVDIMTFLHDDNYLGKAWKDAAGRPKLFPYWEKVLTDLFPDPYTTKVNNLILSGARGLGKSEIAVTCGLYIMYRIMCMKNPHLTYNLKPTETFAFSFMNITETLAMDIGINKFQATVKSSPWFMARGTLSGRNPQIWNPPDYINIIIGSQPRHVIGQALIFNFFDEISFI